MLHQPIAKWRFFRQPLVATIVISSFSLQLVHRSCYAHDHLCLEDDYTNDLPIFIEKKSICNYETVPVLVYPIKTSPDTGQEAKLVFSFCLKGACVR